MNRAEALRSTREDLLESIQSKVKVDYDNVRQQLHVLKSGYKIKTVETHYDTIGVNIP